MSRVTDAIVWLGVGVSLVAQAAFILMPVVMYDAGDGAGSPRVPLIESVLVGTGFLVAGGAALWRGVGRVRSRRIEASSAPIRE